MVKNMHNSKKIILLLLAVVMVLAGMSSMAFASEYSEDDWRFSEDGTVLTLYPGQLFVTDSSAVVPDWATKVNAKDPAFFWHSEVSEGILNLGVSYGLQTGQNTVITLKGFWWWQDKEITVKIDRGSEYSTSVVLNQDKLEERVKLPLGAVVKGVEVVEGYGCISARAVEADKNYRTPGVLIGAVKNGTAKINISYKDEKTDSIESAVIDVTVEPFEAPAIDVPEPTLPKKVVQKNPVDDAVPLFYGTTQCVEEWVSFENCNKNDLDVDISATYIDDGTYVDASTLLDVSVENNGNVVLKSVQKLDEVTQVGLDIKFYDPADHTWPLFRSGFMVILLPASESPAWYVDELLIDCCPLHLTVEDNTKFTLKYKQDLLKLLGYSAMDHLYINMPDGTKAILNTVEGTVEIPRGLGTVTKSVDQNTGTLSLQFEFGNYTLGENELPGSPGEKIPIYINLGNNDALLILTFDGRNYQYQYDLELGKTGVARTLRNIITHSGARYLALSCEDTNLNISHFGDYLYFYSEYKSLNAEVTALAASFEGGGYSGYRVIGCKVTSS